MTGYTFSKEVIGAFEAGGRFIALRMDASYPLPDGRRMHKALVIVGSEPSSDTIKAHVYTDGGTVREYCIESGDGQLHFDDVPRVTGNFGTSPQNPEADTGRIRRATRSG